MISSAIRISSNWW